MRPKEMNDVKAIAAQTYNTAADLYDAPALSFWDRIGGRTVEQLSPQPGAWVLDACCGSGASTIPAALAVGPSGRVLGVDLAENLLRLGRSKAAQLGLSHMEFRHGDIEALDPTRETFDAVVCVLGIFFLADMSAGVRHLWRFVRPGGQMAITTWGLRVLEPGSSAFWLAVRDERPDLYKGYNPWDRINEPAALATMLLEGGVHTAKIAAESGVQALNSPEEFWTIALGSGYRSVIEQLDKVSRDKVRNATLDRMCKQNVRSVETNAIYAIARKP
ncbi:MAG TPA: class I SAM-dependent methyltransferase [Candidatus Acidoferrum sp.]|nr:class I SAM-dependent methyltransferase [Candidatus Acidoferrum sp.]